jgi:hypothetical protein
VRLLTIAGALVAAEIDRLTRQQQKEMASMPPAARNAGRIFTRCGATPTTANTIKTPGRLPGAAAQRTFIGHTRHARPAGAGVVYVNTGTNAAAPPEEDDVPF